MSAPATRTPIEARLRAAGLAPLPRTVLLGRQGDRATGRQGDRAITVEELARLRTTNTWATVTAMAGRLPRVYHAAAAPAEIRSLVTGRDR
jgi:hypothetical protein